MSLVRWALVLPPLVARHARAERSSRSSELIQAHIGAICRTARRLGVPERDLEDVAQEVLLVVVRRQADIEPEKERAFILGTTLRLAANRRRRRRRRPEDPSGSIDEPPAGVLAVSAEHARARGERAIETAQQLALLNTALAEMTEAQREVFVCFELEELTAREIAEQLGLTEATVVSRVRRAREVLWRVCRRHGNVLAAIESSCEEEEP